jgi:hypothetical protein
LMINGQAMLNSALVSRPKRRTFCCI